MTVSGEPWRVRPGDVVAGKYTVERVLGEGGMGVVLSATHRELGRKVALKVMRAGAHATADMLARFQREARAAAKLTSDHVAHVLDVGVTDSGDPYIVMEHLEGSDLAVVLAGIGKLPSNVVATLMGQVCEAIGEAHASGIVHRDLKPSNLFLTKTISGAPRVKVLDFGISKLREQDAATTTQSSTLLGTPLYMAPEQMLSPKDADGRADIWSLGVVMFELLTGELPWKAENVAALAVAVTTSAAPRASSIADVPAAMDDVVAKCLQRSPNDRFQSVAELATALAPLASSAAFDWGLAATVAAPRAAADISTAKTELAAAATPLAGASTMPPAPERKRPEGWVAIAIGVVVVGAAGMTAMYVSPQSPPKSKSPPPTASASAPAAPTARPARHACNDQTQDGGSMSPTECASGVAWCDAHEQRIACCTAPLVATGEDGLCECPPGGARADAGTSACAPTKETAESRTAAIRSAMRAQFDAIKKCSVTKQTGRVEFWIELTPDGDVYLARIRESSYADPAEQACMLRVVRAIHFGAPPGGAETIGYPLIFDSK